MSEMVYCQIRIKKEEISYSRRAGLTYPQRAAEQKRIEDEYKLNFYTVVNKVVEAGGVFCHTKTHFDYNYKMYDQNVRIKIPKDEAKKLAGLGLIDRLTIG